jgi:hypothetical protein
VLGNKKKLNLKIISEWWGFVLVLLLNSTQRINFKNS